MTDTQEPASLAAVRAAFPVDEERLRIVDQALADLETNGTPQRWTVLALAMGRSETAARQWHRDAVARRNNRQAATT